MTATIPRDVAFAFDGGTDLGIDVVEGVNNTISPDTLAVVMLERQFVFALARSSAAFTADDADLGDKYLTTALYIMQMMDTEGRREHARQAALEAAAQHGTQDDASYFGFIIAVVFKRADSYNAETIRKRWEERAMDIPVIFPVRSLKTGEE